MVGKAWLAAFSSIVVAGCGSDASAPVQELPAKEAGTESGVGGDSGAAKDSSIDAPKAEGGGGAEAGGEAGTGKDGADEPEAALEPKVVLPRTGLVASELALLVNDDDPQSIAVADYYQKARGIPSGNVIHLKAPVADNWPRADFQTVKAEVEAKVPASVQAFAISWTRPYKVDCMSVVSAFALGFDEKYCNTKGGCVPTASVDYFDSDSTQPWTDHQLRPAMMLVGEDADQAKAVIDHGVQSEGTFPKGDGYFLRTTDEARSVRYQDFQDTVQEWDHADGLTLAYIDNSKGSGSDYLENKTNVLFYLTGLASVPSIEKNQYVPGAVADHLTSYGGQVPTSGQMSIAKWLKAGVTASFGTVVEPCNFTDKFPVASVLLHHYFRGETILEAYWKSVATPGEGNFAGEPLARPWGTKSSYSKGTLTLETTVLRPGVTYELRQANSEAGPWTKVQGDISVTQYQFKTITLPSATAPYYRLAEVGEP